MAERVYFKGKGQALRLSIQQNLGGGPLSIFGPAAQKHDLSIRKVSAGVLATLADDFPNLEFQQRNSLSKREIHEKLNKIDARLGRTIFVDSSSIRPDGAITEVKDKYGNWRVVLVGESKHQGNDVEKIRAGVKQGKNKDQDFMVAGNAIERVHKNIQEMKNFLIDESYFPYVVFLQGSNFATETFYVKSPDGREIEVSHKSGQLNRIDRVTASNFGMEINKNYCENILVSIDGVPQTLQIASLYFQADPWSAQDMADVMLAVSRKAIKVLGSDLEY